MFGIENFDIVIGNPPYIQLQKDGGKLAKEYQDYAYKTFARSGDIYSLFYEKGYQLLKLNGNLCYITSNQWMRTGYGEKTRKFFVEETNPVLIVDFAGQQIFEAATVNTNIFLFTKSTNLNRTSCCVILQKPAKTLLEYYAENQTVNTFTSSNWIVGLDIEKDIMDKVVSVGTPLENWNIKINFGIKTGYNEAFIIDENTKDHLTKKDSKSKELIKPLLRGRDIQKYYSTPTGYYLICTFPSLHINIEKYPAIKEYLLNFGKERLEQSGKKGSRKKSNNKWFETQDSISFNQEFLKPKIIWKRIGSKLRFCYDDSGCFALDSTCIATGENIKYLTCFLNSKIGNYLLQSSPKTGTGDLLISVQALQPLLVPKPTTELNKIFEDLLDGQIKGETNEAEINFQFYRLFNLTPEEISFIENQ